MTESARASPATPARVPYAQDDRPDDDAGGAPGGERSELYFCASFLAQTKKERGATSGLTHKAAVQISLV